MARYGIRFIIFVFVVSLLLLISSRLIGHVLASPVLTFIANGHGNRDIFLFDVRTHQLYNYTSSPTLEEWSYVWSKDGEQIIFATPTDRGDSIYVMNADASQRRQVQGLTTLQAFNLTWSPDGDELVYFSSYQNSSELYLISLEENTVRNLTNTPDISEAFPEWSPTNPDMLLFTMHNDVFAMDMKTGARTLVTDTPNREDYVVWSPDGTRFVFQRPREFSGEPQLFMFTLADNKDEHLRKILAPRSQPVSWSPDSTAFAIALDSQQIIIYNVETKTINAITDGTQRASGAVWSPDGRYIAYIENRQIQIYDLNQGQTIPLDLEIAIQPPLIWQP